MKSSLQEIHNRRFDYIVVGGGTSGCLLAARLAQEITLEHGVLLVEAGGEAEEDTDNLIPGLTKSKYGNEAGNWLYSTEPQAELNGRSIAYPRGLGMGGCSTNNFLAWVQGPRADFDDWAQLVDDPWWKWDSVIRIMKKLEDFRPQCPEGEERYAKPTPEAHGQGGKFAVGYGQTWQPMVEKCLLAAHEAGHAFNKDHNDGDPEGISVAQFNVDNGVRTTSSTAFLNEQARSSIQNLRTITRTICAKVIFEGRTAIGVELEPAKPDGTDKKTTVYANKEVILSAGCFESPHILLLSGVGSSNHLASLGIPLIHDLPAVGQNLRDHSTLTCEFIIDPSIAGHNQLLNDPAAMNTALEEYNEYKTGPLVVFGASAAVVFSRLPQLFATKEFSDLSENSRSFLMNENRPGTEIWMHSGPQYYTGPCPPDASVLVLEGLCQNNISHGSVTLSSKDARVPPLIDPSYLSEPYDFRIAIETLKEMIKISNTPTFSSLIRSILHGPRSPLNYDSLASPSDEVVLKNFIRDTLQQGYHGMGTCMMGKLGDANRVVGSDFKVIDVEGLRVADMSICPILTTNHTQVNAYLIGERCADLVIQESKEQPKYLKM